MNNVLDLSAEEINEKALELKIAKSTFEYEEDELETKICSCCGELFDSSNFPFNISEFERMSFCCDCGGELEDNSTLDVYDCMVCNVSLHELGEGYIMKKEQKGVCFQCYHELPDITEKEKEELEEKRKNLPRLRMISPSELVGKTIETSYNVKWNGALVTKTTDNCICVSYSNYDHFTDKTSFHHLTDLNDYFRLC